MWVKSVFRQWATSRGSFYWVGLKSLFSFRLYEPTFMRESVQLNPYCTRLTFYHFTGICDYGYEHNVWWAEWRGCGGWGWQQINLTWQRSTIRGHASHVTMNSYNPGIDSVNYRCVRVWQEGWGANTWRCVCVCVCRWTLQHWRVGIGSSTAVIFARQKPAINWQLLSGDNSGQWKKFVFH